MTDGYLVRAGATNLALRSFSLGLVFLSHLLLARLLLANSYGLYAYALAWMRALSVPATLGLERLVIREVAASRSRSDSASWRGLIVWAQRSLLTASTGIALFAILTAWLIARDSTGLHTFWLAMILLPLVALTRLRQFVLQGMHRTTIGQVPETTIIPLLLILFVVSYFSLAGQLTPTTAMALNVAATAVALICATLLLNRALPGSVKTASPKIDSRVWLQSAIPMLLVTGVNSINGQIPILVIGALNGTETAGIFSVTKRLADLTMIPTISLSAVLTPTLADLWAKRDKSGLERTTIRCAQGITLVTLPIASTFIFFGKPFLQLFGTPFTVGTTTLTILCIGHLINVAAGSNGLLLVMTGHEREVAFITISCALLNLASCFALVPRWGLAGGAVAVTLSLTLWNVWLIWRVRQILNLRTTMFARVTSNRQNQ